MRRTQPFARRLWQSHRASENDSFPQVNDAYLEYVVMLRYIIAFSSEMITVTIPLQILEKNYEKTRTQLSKT